MIPYDDLVVALQTWRAKQGLPVLALSSQFAPPPTQEAFIANVTPPPLAAASTDDAHEEVDGALIEEHYEAEPTDFAQNYNQDVESTSIGSMDNGPGGTEAASPAGRTRDRGEDW